MVSVPFHQDTVVQNFLGLNPHLSDVNMSFDRSVYDKQTMVNGKKDEILVLHANHICIIQVTGVHVNHTGYQSNGTHCLWMTHCAKMSYTLQFKKFEIENWLHTDYQISRFI